MDLNLISTGGCERERVGETPGDIRCWSLRDVKRPFAEPLGKLPGDPAEIPDGLPRSASLPRNDNWSGSAIIFTLSGERVVVPPLAHARSYNAFDRYAQIGIWS